MIASCGYIPRDNRCVYMAHVCFYVCCSDCVGVCGNVCCVAAVVKNSGFLSLGVLKYVVSVKCSAHRLACICSVVSAFPSLYLTMLAATLVCLQSCFVILYTVLSSPFCAAVSAFSASLST